MNGVAVACVAPGPRALAAGQWKRIVVARDRELRRAGLWKARADLRDYSADDARHRARIAVAHADIDLRPEGEQVEDVAAALALEHAQIDVVGVDHREG